MDAITAKTEEQQMFAFAEVLERAGYSGALRLLQKELLPLAKSMRTSLVHAAWTYADGNEEHETTMYRLWEALQAIDDAVLDQCNIFTPHVREESVVK